MESGAKGVEVVVSGKVRGQRAKSMKFVDGLMIHSGDPVKVYTRSAVRHVLLRQGVLGIKVKIMLPYDPSSTIAPRPGDAKKAALGPSTPLPDNIQIMVPKSDKHIDTPWSENVQEKKMNKDDVSAGGEKVQTVLPTTPIAAPQHQQPVPVVQPASQGGYPGMPQYQGHQAMQSAGHGMQQNQSNVGYQGGPQANQGMAPAQQQPYQQGGGYNQQNMPPTNQYQHY
jgi:hypothetical protein